MRLRFPIVCCFAIAVLCALPASGQETRDGEWFDPTFGRSKLSIPEATTEGEWAGSWLYINRDIRVALWFRETEGIPEYKYRFQRNNGPEEEFETDWAGHARYTTLGAPGEFDLVINEGDDNALQGTWHWNVQFKDSSKRETANLTINRTGDGRSLVLFFDDLQLSMMRGTNEQVASIDQAWTFRKVSKRVVRWEEMP